MSSTAESDSPVILVTGSNKGLGYEVVRLLSDRYSNGIILLCARNSQLGNDAVNKLNKKNVKFIQLDVTDKNSIQQAYHDIQTTYKRLDILVNNAGIAKRSHDYDSAVDTFNVNYYGVQNTIDIFLPLIKQSQQGRIVIVSSEVGAWTHYQQPDSIQHMLDNYHSLSVEQANVLAHDYIQLLKSGQSQYPWRVPADTSGYSPDNIDKSIYGTSKALVSSYGRVLAQALKQYNIPVILVCPGYCATDLNNNSGYRSTTQGAMSIIGAINIPLEHTGVFIQDNQHKPIKYQMDLHTQLQNHKKQQQQHQQQQQQQ